MPRRAKTKPYLLGVWAILYRSILLGVVRRVGKRGDGSGIPYSRRKSHGHADSYGGSLHCGDGGLAAAVDGEGNAAAAVVFISLVSCLFLSSIREFNGS